MHSHVFNRREEILWKLTLQSLKLIHQNGLLSIYNILKTCVTFASSDVISITCLHLQLASAVPPTQGSAKSFPRVSRRPGNEPVMSGW